MKYERASLQIFPACEALHMGHTGAGDMPDNAHELIQWLKGRAENWVATSSPYDSAVLMLVHATISEYEAARGDDS